MLILLRHGRTEANRSALLQGRVDNELDAVGEEQAKRAAAHLSATLPGGIHRVISSPLLRARQTADALHLPVEIDERLVELSYGDWEERPLAEVSAETWREWRHDLDFRPPGGETLNELGRRVREVANELLPDIADTNIVVVAHVSPIKAALAWALHTDDRIGWNIHVAHASISRINARRGEPVLASLNELV